MRSYHVVIVGGGPGGSSCARRLSEAGVSCLIIDKEEFPRQKTCAGWVTPDVFKLLGIHPEQYPFDLTIFRNLRIHFKGFPLPRPGTQFAIRRLEFDNWLLGLSQTEFLRHEVKEIERSGSGYVLDGRIEAQVLVGAGGTHCPVARMVRPDKTARDGARIVALESEYPLDWQDPACRLWFFENKLPGYFWYIPKSGGYLNIGAGGNAAALKKTGSSIQDQWEYLAGKLQREGLIKEDPPDPRGYVYYLRGRSPLPAEKDVYLVGDALGLATLDMGEGIGPAIYSGQLAAEAILQKTPYSVERIPKYSLLPPGLRWLLG